MLSEALAFLKDRLNTHLQMIKGDDGAQPAQVDFITGDTVEALTFKSGVVSVLLINMEEEATLRAPDLYRRTAAGGAQQIVQPAIRLNLYVLFVARYAKYEQSLAALAHIIRYFQQHRVFAHGDAPELSEQIERLTVELITLPFAQQNEVWSALRVAYQPSALYKVKMIVFQDEAAEALPAPPIVETSLRTAQ
jgi:hypothetical protein